MKRITTLLLSLATSAVMAQIPNAGFENWTSGAPDGWTVTTAGISGSVTQASPGYSGNYAVSFNSVQILSYYAGGLIKSGGSSGFFSNTGNFGVLTGWYKLNSVGGDEFYIGVATKCPNDTAN